MRLGSIISIQEGCLRGKFLSRILTTIVVLGRFPGTSIVKLFFRSAHLSRLRGETKDTFWCPLFLNCYKGIAVAWVPYEFTVNGAFSHCGIDVFTLMKRDGNWQIVTAAYTVEKEDCDTLENKN